MQKCGSSASELPRFLNERYSINVPTAFTPDVLSLGSVITDHPAKQEKQRKFGYPFRFVDIATRLATDA